MVTINIDKNKYRKKYRENIEKKGVLRLQHGKKKTN